MIEMACLRGRLILRTSPSLSYRRLPSTDRNNARSYPFDYPLAEENRHSSVFLSSFVSYNLHRVCRRFLCPFCLFSND